MIPADPDAALLARAVEGDGAAFSECSSPQAYSGLADGSHSFAVRARDAVGNVDTTPASFTWTVDTTTPETTIDGGPTDPTSATDATFDFSSDDPAATFECSLDGSPFQACSSPAGYTGLATGAHEFDVRAVDAAGNVDPTPAAYTWSIS